MEQSISSDLIRGHIDTIILYSLIDGDKYAQQISDTVEQKSDSKYKINQATLYSSLKRLELLKHISSYWQDADNGRRKFFHLTEKGKQVVEDNLSNWSYSKNIIDKLMDVKTEPTVEPKVLYVVKETEKIESPLPASSTSTNDNIEEKVCVSEPVQNTTAENKTDLSNSDKNDVNFRLILNPLIKRKEVKKIEETTVQEEPKTVETVPQNEKFDFNQTVTNSDYNQDNLNYNGRLDFGDLRIKAAQEGYKIRVSSKDSASKSGKLMINKLNFFTSLILAFLLIIEFIPFCFVVSPILNISGLEITLFFVIVFSPIIFFIVKYIFSPYKTTYKKPSGDVILTTAIIMFNLLLITFAVALLSGLDLTLETNLVKYLYSPFIIMVDILIFLIVRLKLSKNKSVITK